MKQWLPCKESPAPILLQMDIDFEGFRSGSFGRILDRFQQNRDLQFLQCSSDWDSAEFPTRSDPLLRLGSTLMLELPQILKEALKDQTIPEFSRLQILFGETIQRGIQVPQAERIGSFAAKGGYGLLRQGCDELDLNIRMSGLRNPKGVESTSETTFLWNNRRAVAAWLGSGTPPISQWQVPFLADDWVRLAVQTPGELRAPSSVEALKVMNQTLARFPLPTLLPGVYDDPRAAVRGVLERLGLEVAQYDLLTTSDGRGRSLVQLQMKEVN